MFIGCPYVIEAAGKGSGRWLLAFSRIKRLTMDIPKRDPKPMTISLVPFHGFSPVLKSLRVDSSALTHSQIFDLVCSFPRGSLHRRPRSRQLGLQQKVDCYPTLPFTPVHWIPEAPYPRWDAFYRIPVVVPTERYPPPETGSDMASRGRRFAHKGPGGWVPFHP